jgi:hypothetical protein
MAEASNATNPGTTSTTLPASTPHAPGAICDDIDRRVRQLIDELVLSSTA